MKILKKSEIDKFISGSCVDLYVERFLEHNGRLYLLNDWGMKIGRVSKRIFDWYSFVPHKRTAINVMLYKFVLSHNQNKQPMYDNNKNNQNVSDGGENPKPPLPPQGPPKKDEDEATSTTTDDGGENPKPPLPPLPPK